MCDVTYGRPPKKHGRVEFCSNLDCKISLTLYLDVHEVYSLTCQHLKTWRWIKKVEYFHSLSAKTHFNNFQTFHNIESFFLSITNRMLFFDADEWFTYISGQQHMWKYWNETLYITCIGVEQLRSKQKEKELERERES